MWRGGPPEGITARKYPLEPAPLRFHGWWAPLRPPRLAPPSRLIRPPPIPKFRAQGAVKVLLEQLSKAARPLAPKGGAMVHRVGFRAATGRKVDRSPDAPPDARPIPIARGYLGWAPPPPCRFPCKRGHLGERRPAARGVVDDLGVIDPLRYPWRSASATGRSWAGPWWSFVCNNPDRPSPCMMMVDEWSKPCLGATASGTEAITRHITAHTVTQLAEPNTAGARRNTSSRPISASAGPSSFPSQNEPRAVGHSGGGRPASGRPAGGWGRRPGDAGGGGRPAVRRGGPGPAAGGAVAARRRRPRWRGGGRQRRPAWTFRGPAGDAGRRGAQPRRFLREPGQRRVARALGGLPRLAAQDRPCPGAPRPPAPPRCGATPGRPPGWQAAPSPSKPQQTPGAGG